MHLPEDVKKAAREAAYEVSFGTGRPHVNRIVNAALAAIEDHSAMNPDEGDTKDGGNLTQANVFDQVPPRYIQ